MARRIYAPREVQRQQSYQDPSLHCVWFDPTLTDAVGGSGVYMQFHSDSPNPWNGGYLELSGGQAAQRMTVHSIPSS